MYGEHVEHGEHEHDEQGEHGQNGHNIVILITLHLEHIRNTFIVLSFCYNYCVLCVMLNKGTYTAQYKTTNLTSSSVERQHKGSKSALR